MKRSSYEYAMKMNTVLLAIEFIIVVMSIVFDADKSIIKNFIILGLFQSSLYFAIVFIDK